MKSSSLRFEQPVAPINAFQTGCGTVTVEAVDDDTGGGSTGPSPDPGSGGGIIPGVSDQVALLAVVVLLAAGAVVVL